MYCRTGTKRAASAGSSSSGKKRENRYLVRLVYASTLGRRVPCSDASKFSRTRRKISSSPGCISTKVRGLYTLR